MSTLAISSPPWEDSPPTEIVRGDDAFLELEGAIEAEELRAGIRAVLTRHSGPLPHPEILAGYRDVDPRSLDWVLDSASQEQAHRHWCEKEPLRQAGLAQWFAFVITVLVILTGGALIHADKSAAGLATILIPLATLLGIFIYREIRSPNHGEGDET